MLIHFENFSIEHQANKIIASVLGQLTKPRDNACSGVLLASDRKIVA